MKFQWIFALVAVFVAVAWGAPAQKTNFNECLKACGYNYSPICAGPKEGAEKPQTFGNICALETYNCEHKTEWEVKSQGECPGGSAIRLQY
ncbi:vasotab [Lutzomyia longipalpis]|uniref:Putative kazal-type serine proteinase inhibitor n=1 Tax=Lutzomyia longipalpis TaxID=7200 RepID=A0A1B0EUB7_LUTLO|nr:vasotab [Lutzomyia longipalpis]